MDLDWETINSAVIERMAQLGLDEVAVADRAGCHVRTVTNLRTRKVSATKTLPAASRALDWPKEALLQLGRGDVTPAELPHEPWELSRPASDADLEERLAETDVNVARLRIHHGELRSEVKVVRSEVSEVSGDVASLRGEVSELRQLLEGLSDELET